MAETKNVPDRNKVLEQIHELQKIEQEILLDVDAFCGKHHIQYFLGEGTLLGAVRHQGFIPWDDDVDIIMKRSEYERFLSLAPGEMSDKYEIQHSTTVENYWSPFIKVRLKGEDHKYRQQHIAHLTENNGPYIDIFPMEYVPAMTSGKQRRQGFYIRFLRGMLSLKLGLRKPRNIKQAILKILSLFYSVKKIHLELDRTFKLYGDEKRDYISTLASYHPLACQTVPATVYDEALWVDFAGHLLPIPKDYDLLLTTIYGDYMTPPPEEKRVIKHHFYDGSVD